MMASNSVDSHRGDSGAADITYEQCSKLGKKALIVIEKGKNERHPCQIVDVSTSKPGKHGSAKARITALDIFTSKKLEAMAGTKDNMEVPNIKKEDENTVMNIDEDWFTILSKMTSELEDVQLAPKLQDQKAAIKQRFDDCEKNNEEMQVSVWRWSDKSFVVGYKIIALD